MRPFASCNASIASCFWGEPAGALPVFVLSVYRIEGRADFGSADVTLVEGVYPFIASAVARLHEREKAKSMRDGLAITGRDGSRGLVVLDSNLRLIEANAQGRRLAGAWAILSPKRPGDTASAWLLPQQLAKECRAMRRAWEASLSANPDATALRRRTKILHPRVATLSASISMVCRNTSGLSEPTFVLEFERRARRVTIRARRDGPLLQTLTEAQRAVAVVLMEGASNQEIADRLAKSVDAVKFLLHRIYQKTGVRGRAALVARLRTRPRPSALRHQLKNEPETHGDEDQSEHHLCTAASLPLVVFVLRLPFAPAFGVGFLCGRNERNTHLLTVRENADGDCSIVNSALVNIARRRSAYHGLTTERVRSGALPRRPHP